MNEIMVYYSKDDIKKYVFELLDEEIVCISYQDDSVYQSFGEFALDDFIEFLNEDVKEVIFINSDYTEALVKNGFQLRLGHGLHAFILNLEDTHDQVIIATNYESAYRRAHEYLKEYLYCIEYELFGDEGFEINEIDNLYKNLYEMYSEIKCDDVFDFYNWMLEDDD